MVNNSRCLYNNSFSEFLNESNDSVSGKICNNYHGNIPTTTRESWKKEIEIMKKDGQDIKTKVVSIKDEKGNEMDSCPHPQQKIFVELDKAPDVGDILKM